MSISKDKIINKVMKNNYELNQYYEDKKIVRLHRVYYNIPDERRGIFYYPEYIDWDYNIHEIHYKYQIISDIDIKDCPKILEGEFNDIDPDIYCTKFLFNKYFKNNIRIMRVINWFDNYGNLIIDRYTFNSEDYKYGI